MIFSASDRIMSTSPAQADAIPEAPATVPAHVAIIMDGNGRWAKRQGKSRLRGHEAGAESVREAIRCCRKYGVKYLTLYAFSIENWVRPKAEIQGLMRLLRQFLKRNEFELHENQVRLRVMGRREDLPRDIDKELVRVEQATAQYTAGQLVLALSYGGRTEIVQAIQAIAAGVQRGELAPDAIDENTLREHLYLPDVPDPDLIVRTSGEMRLSNFLLWQCSYSEFYVTPTLWPDFREAQFVEALNDYARRQRRFGDVEARSKKSKGTTAC